MRTPTALPAALSALLVTSCLLAQTTYAIGIRDIALPNTTGQGSGSLTARVHYPAASAGSNVPVLAQQGGWPVVVFLHGFLALGNNYAPVGNALAAAGYIAVMSNTMQFDNQGQEYDGRALYSALVTANGAAGGAFTGALDMGRAALIGHSMGGGNVGNVLANNPGYRCGVGLAPVAPRGNNGALVTAPMAIVAGLGDSIAPYSTYALPYYQGLTGYSGLKALYVFNNDGTHLNIPGYTIITATDTAVFQRSMSVTLGFLDRWLRNRADGLENVVGPAARSDTRLNALSQEIAAPQVWPAANLAIGQTTRISVASEAGPCGVLAAGSFAAAPAATPFGNLLLDGATAFVAISSVAGTDKRADSNLAVPASPSFLGLRLPVQAYGIGRGSAVTLGNALELVVGN
jgi:pimeloyl-ACP methyl ester carboxylesterase